MWPFKKRLAKSSCFAIGRWRLNLPFDAAAATREFSDAEYQVFTRLFRHEKSWHVKPVKFLDQTWTVMVGTINGQIYKIAATFESTDVALWRSVSLSLTQYCNGRFGAPWKDSLAIQLWEATDGNAVVQRAELLDEMMVALYLTSNSAAKFNNLS